MLGHLALVGHIAMRVQTETSRRLFRSVTPVACEQWYRVRGRGKEGQTALRVLRDPAHFNDVHKGGDSLEQDTCLAASDLTPG